MTKTAARHAAETARADALLIAMIDATDDVWAALADPFGPPDVSAAMAFYADAAAARQDIDAIGHRSDYHASPSNPTVYRTALANLRAADQAIIAALDAIAA